MGVHVVWHRSSLEHDPGMGHPESPKRLQAILEALHAAADALDIFHGLAFVGEAHDIDSLMAHRCADVARDALLLVGQDAEA